MNSFWPWDCCDTTSNMCDTTWNICEQRQAKSHESLIVWTRFEQRQRRRCFMNVRHFAARIVFMIHEDDAWCVQQSFMKPHRVDAHPLIKHLWDFHEIFVRRCFMSVFWLESSNIVKRRETTWDIMKHHRTKSHENLIVVKLAAHRRIRRSHIRDIHVVAVALENAVPLCAPDMPDKPCSWIKGSDAAKIGGCAITNMAAPNSSLCGYM
jgi:hypothetical protein